MNTPAAKLDGPAWVHALRKQARANAARRRELIRAMRAEAGDNDRMKKLLTEMEKVS